MLDISNILGGSDNMFKHLFIGGLAMIALSIFYPLEKEQEYANKICAQERDSRLLAIDIENRTKEIKELDNAMASYIRDKSKIKNTRLKKEIDINLDKQFEEIKLAKTEIEKRYAELEYNKSLILAFDAQKKNYSLYVKILFVAGSLFTLIGCIGWAVLMKKLINASQSAKGGNT